MESVQPPLPMPDPASIPAAAAPAESSVAQAIPAARPLPSDLPVVQHRSILLVILSIGLLMMFGGQLQIMRDQPDTMADGGLVIIVIGLGLTLFVLGRQTLLRFDLLDALPTPDAVYTEPVRLKWGWLALSIGLAAFASFRAVQYPQRAYLGEYALLWLGSMAALVMMALPRPGQPYAKDPRPIHAAEWVLIVVLVLGAGLMRLTDLGGMPNLFDQDEAKFAQEGAELLSGHLVENPFGPGIDSHPRVFTSLIALAVGLLGPTMAAARFPAAIAGTLGIGALYLLGREIYGWRVGLVAALFAIPWVVQIFFSRQGMNQPFDPLFATLALYFMLRGLRRRAPVDYVLSGIFLGHAQMYYLGGRLAPFVMVSYLVYQYLRDKDAPPDKQVVVGQWRALLLIPLAAVVVTVPQNVHLLYYHQPISTRADKNIFLGGEFQSMADQGAGTLLNYLKDQFILAFNGLYVTGDRSGWVGPGSPVMGPFGGPLLLLGTVASLGMVWKRPHWCIPIGWALLVIVVTCAFGTTPPYYERYYPAVTALALLVGVGASVIGAAAARALRRDEWRHGVTVMIGVALLIGGVLFYYGDFVPAHQYVNNYRNHYINAVVQEALPRAKNGQFVMILGGYETEIFDSPVMRYLLWDQPYLYTEIPFKNFNDLAIDQRAFDRPLSFIVSKTRVDELDAIRAAYPGGLTTELRAPDEPDKTLFYAYDTFTPASQLAIPSSP